MTGRQVKLGPRSRVLLDALNTNGPMSTRDMCSVLQTPIRHAQQILGTLRKRGLVEPDHVKTHQHPATGKAYPRLYWRAKQC